MSSVPSKTEVKAPTTVPHPPFDVEVRSNLSDEQQRAWRKRRWQDRFTSLWAPVTLFGLFFLVYTAIIESSVCTYLWLQPVMRGIGLLMLAYFVLLGIARLVLRPFATARHLRHQATELRAEVSSVVDRNADKVDGRVRASLVSTAAELDTACAQADSARCAEKLSRLSELSEKHLGPWRKNSTSDFLGGFAKALLLALVIRTILIEPFKIPSGSMIPTLEVGDQIFVNKFIYGVRIPFLNIVPFPIVRRPARGDVIVFNNPVEPDKDFIKRVIGVPGDRIEIHDKVLFINGIAQPSEVLEEAYDFMDQDPTVLIWETKPATLVREVLDGQPHFTLRRRGDPAGEQGPYEVPPGHVFVMGDNRDNSLDSRFGLGLGSGVRHVPYGHIKGKAMVIWLSLAYGGLGSSLFGGTGLRTDRLFRPVSVCAAEVRRQGVTP